MLVIPVPSPYKFYAIFYSKILHNTVKTYINKIAALYHKILDDTMKLRILIADRNSITTILTSTKLSKILTSTKVLSYYPSFIEQDDFLPKKEKNTQKKTNQKRTYTEIRYDLQRYSNIKYCILRFYIKKIYNLKFSAVFGQTSAKSSILIVPIGAPPAVISIKTIGFSGCRSCSASRS